ncbi:MAG: biopolymer transporter ExbD [Cyanobacteria bacterium P01_D01_bin.73]
MYGIEESSEEFELNIIPMIDVIFAILTFFIISSLFLSRTEALPVNLPKADQSEVQDRIRVTVTVEKSGQLSINRKEIALEDLEAGVRGLIEDGKEIVVVINADEEVNHGRVIAVMDKLRGIEGAALGIATERP